MFIYAVVFFLCKLVYISVYFHLCLLILGCLILCSVHVCVLGRSYTCVVVSCLGSCVCDTMLESRGSFLSRIHYCHGRKDSLDV